MCRDIFKAFFLVLLTLSATFTLTFFVIKYQAFNPDIYKNYLENKNVYARLINAAETLFDSSSKNQSAQSFLSEDGLSLNPSSLILQAFITKAVTPTVLQDLTEKTIDNIFAYLKGEKDEVNVEETFQDYFNSYEDKKGLLEQTESQVKDLLKDIPACTDTSTENCIPADLIKDIETFSLEDLIEEQLKNIPSTEELPFKFDGGDFDINDVKFEKSESDLTYNPTNGTLRNLRMLYENIDTILLVTSIATVVLLLITILLTPKNTKSLLNTLATTLLLTGLASAGLSGLIWFGIWSASQTLILGSGYLPIELINLFKDTLSGLIFELQMPIYIISAIFVVLSIFIYIIAKLVSKSDTTNEDQEPTQTTQTEPLTLKRKLTEQPTQTTTETKVSTEEPKVEDTTDKKVV